MKKRILFLAVPIVLIIIFLLVYPNIEIKTENALIALRYSDDISEFDMYGTADETSFYYEKYDISLYDFEVNNFLFFHKITMKYKDGDMRESQFLLKAEYIENLLKNWQITENEGNIDITKMLYGKTAIEQNKRIPFDSFTNSIYYVLDGEENVMHIGEKDGQVLIQIGNSDEGPKYIVYE
ncbi:MAG: hypothetical protein UHE86_01860 [Acutalibacteraceae bacterium]|nr:hypothetical protein [Clostridia bacterium]MEE1277790.1 hypothetical protein [Acutalibacteraceae bacterium]